MDRSKQIETEEAVMWKYLKKYLWLVILGPIFMACEVIVDLLQPKMMTTIVDEGVLGLSNGGVGDLSLILATGGRMLGIIIVGGFCGIMCGVCTNTACMKFSNDLRKDLFKKVMSFSFEQTDAFSTGSLVTRITNDVTQLQALVGQVARGLVRNLVFLFGGIFCIMTLDMSFGTIALCALPVIVIGTGFFILRINPMFSVLQKKLDRVNSVMQENVTGARVVKAYVREAYEERRFDEANSDLVGTQLRILELVSFISPIMNIALNVSVVAVIKVGAVHVMEGTTTPGSIMAAITYLSQILGSVMVFAGITQQLSRGLASWKRIREVLDTRPVIADGPGVAPESRENVDGAAAVPESGAATDDPATVSERHATAGTRGGASVEFRNVSFHYPGGNGETILDHVNLKIAAGETIGIMGATGCGKTTLVQLIPRFYDPSEGAVLIDGIDVKEYTLTKLRDQVAISLQKSEIFGETIGENIRWGNPQADDTAVETAAKAAQADDFIRGKEEGYDTQVAEKGMSLSGGQKQRLSIARALLKDARILILDDATSALDLKTEARLYEALDASYAGMTRIIIAQRVASVKNADRIAVIDEGHIVAFDSHEKLMESCSQYQDIYESQLGGVAS
jgi:ATP-binding cassette subfamily B protein